ncbi:olfactory receptor 52D1-like isoform X2 [Hemicordylus capensis]|uniref:olfactory receptor 52D1-like isoform X2 n=1 Tax=Hemicordylus capensis TaxID=884348 RepID=UPI002303C986|nr:olfactory receptor 52D1-like isoform X2 [Hemicordylus capensis]
MSKSSSTQVTPPSFFLVGVPGLESAHVLLAFPFCVAYVLALVGNGTVFLVICVERRLHQPMYLLLAMLSLVDVGLSSSTTPKMLAIFWLSAHDMAFHACLAQMFFIHAFTALESGLLLLMAFDRYVAVREPLRYSAILTNLTIAKMGVAILSRALALLIPLVLLAVRLPFCRTWVVIHTYCEHMAVVKLACGDTTLNSTYGLVVVVMVIGFDVVFIAVSYVLILGTVFQLPSWDARQKALGTCSSHLCIILLFYIPAVFSFLTHRFGHGVAPYIHILLANLYLFIPPALNPIVYGWRTKPIRQKILHALHCCKG